MAYERSSPVTETEEYRYARNLLVHFVEEHFPHNPDWRPLPDLIGVLTQIDNAITIARDYKARLSGGLAPTPAVPEGYVLIPREPTREMWAACGDAVVGNTSVHHDVVVRLMYRAIVALADTSTDREGK
jgi:hypothetical protein